MNVRAIMTEEMRSWQPDAKLAAPTGKAYYLLLLLTAAGLLPAASISTSAFCDPFSPQLVGPIVSHGGGPGAPHADCSGYILDRGQPRGNFASADVSAGSVLAQYSVYRFAPLSVSSSAFYQEMFEVTFFGGSGFGIFEPCLSARGSGDQAHAVATLIPPGGRSSIRCPNHS